MVPIWGQQDPGGPHVGPMNFTIWDPFGGNVIMNMHLMIFHNVDKTLNDHGTSLRDKWYIYVENT